MICNLVYPLPVDAFVAGLKVKERMGNEGMYHDVVMCVRSPGIFGPERLGVGGSTR